MRPDIHLTERDRALLSELVSRGAPRSPEVLDTLEAELLRATIVGEADARDRVRLGTRVTWDTGAGGERRTARLVLPSDVEGPGDLSVLTPVGCALIGLRRGDAFVWADGARQWRLRVVDVDHGPPAP